jgi:prepilin-type N-terminal cleavage/methylation domain-containing protein
MNERGYSLVELLVAISMSTILVLAIGNFATNSVVSTNQDYNKTLVLTNAKEAVTVVARQIRFATSVLDENSLDDDNAPGAPADLTSWSGAAGVGSPLILAVPSRDGSGNIMFQDGMHTKLYTDNVIFYLDSTTGKLMKRTIVHPVAIAAGTTAKTTCPPPIATTLCPADVTVVDDVASLTTGYLDENGTTPSLPSGTEAVNYTVTETRVISGRTYSGTYSTIATLRNK